MRERERRERKNRKTVLVWEEKLKGKVNEAPNFLPLFVFNNLEK